MSYSSNTYNHIKSKLSELSDRQKQEVSDILSNIYDLNGTDTEQRLVGTYECEVETYTFDNTHSVSDRAEPSMYLTIIDGHIAKLESIPIDEDSLEYIFDKRETVFDRTDDVIDTIREEKEDEE